MPNSPRPDERVRRVNAGVGPAAPVRRLGGGAPPPAGPPVGGDAADGHERLLAGLRVLVVEDDFIVAYDMQSVLEEHGADVLGPATSLKQARALLERASPDLAVLDVNLCGEFVFPLAEELRSRGVPFLFATAYSDDERLFPDPVKTVRRLSKPVHPNVLVRQLARLRDGG